MRILSLLPSLSILMLMGLSGCQNGRDLTTGPRTLEPAAPPGACPDWPNCPDQPGGAPSPGAGEGANYDITLAGDLSGTGQTDDRTTGVTARDYTIDDLGTFLGVVDGGATCFPSASYTGSFHAELADDGSIDVGFAFDALNQNGREARYTFLAHGGEVTSGEWFPDPDGTATVVGFVSDSWSVAKGGKGGSSACSGGGALTMTMTVFEL
jgi:hypothetical protein